MHGDIHSSDIYKSEKLERAQRLGTGADEQTGSGGQAELRGQGAWVCAGSAGEGASLGGQTDPPAQTHSDSSLTVSTSSQLLHVHSVKSVTFLVIRRL